MKTITEKEALNKMAAYCSKGEHCTYDISEKLKKYDLSDDSIQTIIKKLQKEKYIDDDRFCKAFINDKIRFSKWGKLKIAQALYQKRINSDIIKSNLSDIDMDEYRKILQNHIHDKKKSVRAKDEYELKQKVIRSVMSKGFEMDEILRFINIDD